MKKTIFSLALLSLVASSCSDIDNFINEIIDPNDKEMISFSMSDGSITSAQRVATLQALPQKQVF